MLIPIDSNKISNFRDLINSNSSFIFEKYQNKDGKNLFNLVCSCMDWLTVSVRHLESQSEKSDNIDTRAMQMFSLISSIDLVSESIFQLHRVFINNNTLPFSNEQECFKNRLFDNEDDNTYFKSIRACFGAHPVNLKNTNSRRFASWPFDSHMSNSELTVHLYSNKSDEEDLTMHLNSQELIQFLIKRYNYLDVISSEINIIFKESKLRLNNDYYNGVINDLIIIFETNISDMQLKEIESDYKESLKPLIAEIKYNLQNMLIIDLLNSETLSPKLALMKELNYELGKFYYWVYSTKNDPLIDYYLKKFNTSSNNKYNFSIHDSKKLLFLKVKLMLNKYHQSIDINTLE